ncbi:MAG: phospholipase A [Caldimonas sp.]
MQLLPFRSVHLAFGAGLVTSIACAAAEAPSAGADARALPAALEACAQTRVDAERLACYDRIVAPRVRGGAEAPAGAPTIDATTTAVVPSAAAANAARPEASVGTPGSYFDEFWELGPERKRGTFNFDGYRPNYFFPVHVTSGLNRHPDTPAAGHAGTLPAYRNVEAKLQLSVRTKLYEGLLLPGADLWFAYTQQSLWQIYSGSISRPFRATDHEPELIYIVPAPLELPFGFKTKMVGLGLAHQSNGQALPFSRSWNRWYAYGGIENGNVALTARYNTRIHESDGVDDNPDFTSYRGRTELFALWTPGFATLSALWKTNFRPDRGSLQLDFTMPVRRKDPKGLRWYAQVFSGYGETLIDYNFRQTSFGAGLTLFGW